MIAITKLNGKDQIINCEFIEEDPDTTITMATGRKIIAKESIDDVIDMVIEYKRKIYLHN